MSYFVGGNQADLEVFDYVRYLIDDANTDVIAVVHCVLKASRIPKNS